MFIYMSNIRVRFAPSPTGFLHIGSLRTVLFNYLIAKNLDGKLILRIEDTDEKREVEGATEGLINILDWAGLKFDEGPHVGGDFGPYIQSQRLDIYKNYVDELLIKGEAYYCFCSSERLQKMREDQQNKKQPPRYDRFCRDLSKEEIALKIKQGETYVIRQKMPLNGEIIVNDELRGEIKFQNINLEDHVLLKADCKPTYQLASVIDDYLMKISHVLRGDEWLSSFPKNILLYQAFGWTPPKFIHLPLTLNKEGGKLSKRQGDVSVEDFKAKGYLPEALLNFCVLQGWHPSASKKILTDKKDEILNLEEMAKYFDYYDMGISPSIFDIEKLDYFNGYYIRQMSIEKLAELCLPFLVKDEIIEIIHPSSSREVCNQATKQSHPYNIKIKNKLAGEEINFEYIKQIVELEQERMKKLSEVGELTRFFFEDKLDYSPELLIWKKLTIEEVKENLKQILEQLDKIPNANWTNDSIEEAIISHIQAVGGKIGDYLWPMRVALTGRQASPGPFDVAEVLGKEESLKRIKEIL